MGLLCSIGPVLVMIGALVWTSTAEPIADKQALLDFLHNLTHLPTHLINWTENSPVCTTWRGVACNDQHTRVIALRLPAAELQGKIPPNTLCRLSALKILSLRSNGIWGSFPSDFSQLKDLTNLYLEFNNFSGSLPTDFSAWKNLTVVNLSHNAFDGSIPYSSISKATLLTYLDLSNNFLSGEILDIDTPNLKELNLANNNLTGTVPKSLRRFPSWAFDGNNLTLQNTLPPPLSIQPPNILHERANKKTTTLGEPAILGTIIGGSALILFVAIAVFCMFTISSSRKASKHGIQMKSPMIETYKRKASPEGQENKRSSLVFFDGCNLAFDMEDLLRASAEVLGKGTFGTTYKAALEDGTILVVKRLKEVGAGKREFEQQMEIVGGIRHDNVAAIRAYYYSKDEKLIVYDYYEQRSVSAMLHGKEEGRTPLDWDTRLRIAIGAARGIAHIHNEHGRKLVHGNVKSSNIFLNSKRYGCVSDIGLATLTNPIPAPALRMAGYRAPEITDTQKATHASDVYGFGVLLLELLTGKLPIHGSPGGEEVVHLVRWVNCVVREEWTAEVFDTELLRYPNIEEQMVEMLQIGMACVAKMPEQRPKMSDVERMVEEIGNADRQSSESKSEHSTPTDHNAPEIVSASIPE